MPELQALSLKADKPLIERFLREAGLRLEPGLEYYCGLFDGDTLIAGGGYEKNVIKCLAVAEARRGEDLLSGIVTQLYTQMRQAGENNIFVFTKPAHLRLFTSLGFSMLVKTEDALLLESRKTGISAQLEKWKQETPDTAGTVGAVVMNANPFTLGHRYLIEEAAKQVELLHVFVLQEDKSAFPFQARYQMVRAGTADIPNAAVHAGGAYLISAATFPSYFLKDPSGAAGAYAALDAALFAEQIAPALSVTARFVGTEEDDPLTALYNAALLSVLPEHGVAVHVLPRLQAAGGRVRASTVRARFANQDWQALSSLVPSTTLSYLRSEEGMRLLSRMENRPC